MTVNSSAGSQLKICASAPATFNEAGYTALSFTAVGEITNAGEFGRVYEILMHKPLATRGAVKMKGGYDEGDMSLQLGLDTDDAGQILMKAARNSDSAYSFCVTLQNGDDYYFQALVPGFKVAVGGQGDVTTASSTLAITTSTGGVGIVEVLA